MKVLVACESSGIVRNAFRDKGHEAWSCDLLPADDDSEFHIKGDVLDYLDGKIEQKFCAQTRCTGCVFTDNVNMLDDWVNDRVDLFDNFKEPLMHEEFV